METLLEVRNLTKTYRYRTGLFRRQHVEAVKSVSFTLREGQTLAIIGENGSGKSTLAKMLSGMVEPSSGEVLIDDHPLVYGDYRYRSQRIRMIFQDPSTSLNPRQRIGQLLDAPLRLNTDLEAAEREVRIDQTLRQVGDVAGPRLLLPAYAGLWAETTCRAGTGVDPATQGDCCRRGAGIVGYVDAFADHQPDAGAPGKARHCLHLCDSASGDDEAYQRPGDGDA